MFESDAPVPRLALLENIWCFTESQRHSGCDCNDFRDRGRSRHLATVDGIEWPGATLKFVCVRAALGVTVITKETHGPGM